MADEQARVLARGTARCPDFEGQKRGVRRYLGHELKKVAEGVFDFAPMEQADTTARSREVAHAIADGDLWAADKATADWAESVTRKGVKFDPTFGGTSLAKKADGAKSADGSKEKV